MALRKNVCSRCERENSDEDDFCPDCGTLFKDNVMCSEHPNVKADGVCVICFEPFCRECGLFVNNRVFLCADHSDHEIFEDMARVYGSFDSLEIDYAKSCLEQAELNPMVYSRNAHVLHSGGNDNQFFMPAVDYNGHAVNEIKLIVPFQQVLKAEEILRRLEILH